MSNLLPGWRKVSIADVAKIVIGRTPRTAKKEYYGGSVPFVAPGDLGTTKYIVSAKKFLTPKGSQYAPTIPIGSTLFTCVGIIGKIGIAGKELRTNQQINSVIPINIDSEYLYYTLAYYSKRIEKLARVNVLPIINKTEFENQILIISEDSNLQKAIADLLSTWDEAIEKTEALIAAKEKQFDWLQSTRLKKIKKHPDTKRIPLGKILIYEQPTKYIVNSTDYIDKGIPVLTANQSFILGYTNENDGIFDKHPVIIFDDFTTDIKYVDFPFKVKSSAMKILLSKNNQVDIRYIFIAMNEVKFPLGGHKRHWISEYQFFDIPVPPIKFQQEIANILEIAKKEITILQALTEQYRTQKHGLMQKLLTG